MTLEAKGRIRFNPDVKPTEPQYTLEAKQLGIMADGSGNLEQMIDELTEKVRRAILQEFCVAPSAVHIVGYSMGITFAVEGPVNRSLDEFVIAAGKNEGDDTKVSIQFKDHPPIETDMKRLELAKKTLEVSAATGIPPEDLIKMAKAKNGSAP